MKTLHRGIQALLAAASEAVWRQWAALGSPASSNKDAKAIVDPESLVLITISLSQTDQRLGDMTSWMAARHSDLLSVQRLKNVAGAFPSETKAGIERVAHLALHVGKDFRWKALAAEGNDIPPFLRKKSTYALRLSHPVSLLLRLRCGMGVGVRSDVLSVLLGAAQPMGLSELQAATGYTSQAVRRALDALARARFIEETRSKPARYSTMQSHWFELLGLQSSRPSWRFLNLIYPLIAHLLVFERTYADQTDSDYVLGSHLRDLVERFQPAFAWNQIRAVRLEDHPGAALSSALERTLRETGHWFEEAV